MSRTQGDVRSAITISRNRADFAMAAFMAANYAWAHLYLYEHPTAPKKLLVTAHERPSLIGQLLGTIDSTDYDDVINFIEREAA